MRPLELFGFGSADWGMVEDSYELRFTVDVAMRLLANSPLVSASGGGVGCLLSGKNLPPSSPSANNYLQYNSCRSAPLLSIILTSRIMQVPIALEPLHTLNCCPTGGEGKTLCRDGTKIESSVLGEQYQYGTCMNSRLS
jgi:hypothetical protein